MFQLSTGSEAWIRRVYRSRVLRRLITFDVARLDEVRSEDVRAQVLAYVGTEGKHGKTTYGGRFADLDAVALRYLQPGRPNVVHDVAVSSGITSCEFVDAIEGAGLKVEYHVSDKYNVYYVDGSLIRRIYSADHELLRGSILGVVADPGQRFPFVGSRLLFEILRLDLRLRPRNEARARTVDLFDPKAKRYILEGKLRVIMYDPFVGGHEERFTFVRCMNLLNRGLWFSDQQIASAARHLVASLKDQGVLQIGRTDDSVRRNDVTFLRKVGPGRLAVLEHYNSGSETLAVLNAAGMISSLVADG
jgi:hypothetical protein